MLWALATKGRRIMRGTRLTQRHRRPQAPAPNRHAAALAMGVPSLAAGARDPARAGAGPRLRAALLLSARALLGASPAGLDAWLAAVPAALAGAGSLPAALPALEARASVSACGSWLRPGACAAACACRPSARSAMLARAGAGAGARWWRAAPTSRIHISLTGRTHSCLVTLTRRGAARLHCAAGARPRLRPRRAGQPG
jgi:hypothetical protein